MPLGDFGSTTKPQAAFARSGAGLGLDCSERFPHDFETGAMLLVDVQPTDGDALGATAAAILRQYGIPSDPFVISATSWRIAWVLGKAGYAPRLREHLNASLDLYFGALYGRFPRISLIAAPPNASASGRQQPWIGMAAGAGAGLRFRNHYMVQFVYLSGIDQPAWYGEQVATSHPTVSALHATLGYVFGH